MRPVMASMADLVTLYYPDPRTHHFWRQTMDRAEFVRAVAAFSRQFTQLLTDSDYRTPLIPKSLQGQDGF